MSSWSFLPDNTSKSSDPTRSHRLYGYIAHTSLRRPTFLLNLSLQSYPSMVNSISTGASTTMFTSDSDSGCGPVLILVRLSFLSITQPLQSSIRPLYPTTLPFRQSQSQCAPTVADLYTVHNNTTRNNGSPPRDTPSFSSRFVSTKVSNDVLLLGFCPKRRFPKDHKVYPLRNSPTPTPTPTHYLIPKNQQTNKPTNDRKRMAQWQ